MEDEGVLLHMTASAEQLTVLPGNENKQVEAISVANRYPNCAQEFNGLARPAREQVDKGPKVSFMTTLDRELFPVKMPQNRFGNEICPLRGAPHRGPGCYENEEKTNFWYDIEHKINSTKGYTLGARTGPRLPKDNIFQTPSPTAYQTRCTDLKEFERSKKPFLEGADRFPVYRRDINEVLPGPGVYEHDIRRNRRVQWHQSFGGTPVMMPTIQVRSIIDQNTEKLYSTKEEKKYNRKLAYMKLYYE